MLEQKKKDQDSIPGLTVIEFIEVDHRYFRACSDVVLSAKNDKRKILSAGKSLLERLAPHLEAEAAALGKLLETKGELSFFIEELLQRHHLIKEKMICLKSTIAREERIKELKILAELVLEHMKQEKNYILSRLHGIVEQETLLQLGHEFNDVRKFTLQDLREVPLYAHDRMEWKDLTQKLSSEFLTKMGKFVEDMHH